MMNFNGELPNIFLFNPTCDYAIANGKASWQPNRLLQKMETDLTSLQLFFARNTDFIIVNRLPSAKFTEKLKTIGIHPPGFILKENIIRSTIAEISKNCLFPWGWSPAAHKLLSPLKDSCAESFKNSPVFNWATEHKNLYSKKFAVQVLKQITSTIPSSDLIPQNRIAEICTSKTEVETLISRWGKIMVKAPWSSSGRGLQPVTKIPVHPKVWEKILGVINEQGYVVVEPFLNKAFDFSFQFKLSNEKIEFLGISNFTTDNKGQYVGNSLNGLPVNVSLKIREFQQNVIKTLLDPLISILESTELATLYEGNFGVDTLIYADENDDLKINPCLEINIRQNMGLLSLHLEKLITSGKKGIYRMFYSPGKTFKEFAREMEILHPLVIYNQKIESGFFALTEAFDDSLFGSYILV
ncbi:MAG: hypothetical protein R2757_03960 [Draconibacterium sp.]